MTPGIMFHALQHRLTSLQTAFGSSVPHFLSCMLDCHVPNDAAAAGEASPLEEAGSKENQASPLTSPMGRLGLSSPDVQGLANDKVCPGVHISRASFVAQQ